MFDVDSILVDVLIQLAAQSPLLLVWLVGLILALATWNRHPMVSLLVLVAMLLVAIVAALWLAAGDPLAIQTSAPELEKRGI